MSTIFKNVKILGDLTVAGTTTSVNKEISNISDSYLYLNNGSLSSSDAGGEVVNIAATVVGTATGFVYGITSTTITVPISVMVEAGQFIQVSGAATADNNGLFLVSSVADTTITIVSTPSTPNIFKTSFIADAIDSSYTVSLVTVSVLMHSSTGPALAKGSTLSELIFSNILTESGSSSIYVKLDGSVGGQTVSGGTADGQSLTLRGNAFDDSGFINLSSDVAILGSIDTITNDAINIGLNSASYINIGRSAITTDVKGKLKALDIESNTLSYSIPSDPVSLYQTSSVINLGGSDSTTDMAGKILIGATANLSVTQPISQPPTIITVTSAPTVADLSGLTYFDSIPDIIYNMPSITSFERDGFSMCFYNKGAGNATISFSQLLESMSSLVLSTGDKVTIRFATDRWIFV